MAFGSPVVQNDFHGLVAEINIESAGPRTGPGGIAARHNREIETRAQVGALIERQNDKDRTYRISYGVLLAPIVKSIQEQQQEIEAERQQNADLSPAEMKVPTLLAVARHRGTEISNPSPSSGESASRGNSPSPVEKPGVSRECVGRGRRRGRRRRAWRADMAPRGDNISVRPNSSTAPSMGLAV